MAAFSGHSHGCERFVPLRVDLSSGSPVPVRDDQNGVVYVVATGNHREVYDVTPNPNHAPEPDPARHPTPSSVSRIPGVLARAENTTMDAAPASSDVSGFPATASN